MIAAYVAGPLSSVTEEDAALLDLINIAFGTIKDGLLFFPRDEKAEIERLKRINPGLRVLLSIGGWGAGGFSTMSSTPEGIAAFSASCMDCVKANGLDGLDVDWEYPTSDAAGIDASPDDKQNYTALLASLRKTLDETFPEDGKLLTIAAGSGQSFLNIVEIEKITPLLDYLAVMTYDMAGPWTPAASHHAALYPSKYTFCSVVEAVSICRDAGVPPEKLVIGAAFYARRWTNIPDGGTHGLRQSCDDPNDRQSGYLSLGFGDVARLIDENGQGKDGWLVCHDEEAHARWMYHPEKREFLTYDDEQSAAEKTAYAKASGLRGIMYWQHTSDPTGRLLRAMAKADGKQG